MRKRINILLSLFLYVCLISFSIFLIIYYVSFSWVFFLILIVFNIFTGSIIFITNRLIDVKLSWIMVALCLPVLGVFLYWIFGRPYRFRKKQKVSLNFFKYFYDQENWEFTKNILNSANIDSSVVTTFKYTTKISARPLYENNNIEILSNGPNKFMELIKDLKKAEKYIFINYFILSESEILWVILSILEEKVKAGVEVFIIYDHVGSYFVLSKKTVNKIKKMGIKIYRFAPIRLPYLTGTYNFRNHRKDIIIDGYIGYTGGINLSDSYVHASTKYGFWRDTQIKIVGEAVKSLDLIFRQDWQFITRKILTIPFLDIEEVVKKVQQQEKSLVQIIDDGPLTKESVQKDLFVKFISSAKKRVWITTPYLVPTGDLITVLKNSAYSGVDVRICLPGISDKFLSLDLSRTYYDELIEAGVKIYEFEHVFNHSKMGIFDDEYSIIGSTNLDYRSLYSDHQTLVFVYDKKINEKIEENFLLDFKYSSLIKVNPLKKHNKFYWKVFMLLFRILAPLF